MCRGDLQASFGLQEGAEVLRLLLLRVDEGTVVFDQLIRPTQSLPYPATALARARGQLALLRAIADGQLSSRHRQSASEADPGSEEAATESTEEADDFLEGWGNAQPF